MSYQLYFKTLKGPQAGATKGDKSFASLFAEKYSTYILNFIAVTQIYIYPSAGSQIHPCL